LSVAYKKKHQEICELLISNGADLNCQDGFRLLMENCKKEEMGDLEYLLMHGAPTSGKEPDGMCPLMIASQNGFTGKVRMLLNHSLDELNKKNKDSLSSLHLVCMNNQLAVARLLIEHGADINIESQNKDSPLILACKNNNKEIVELLIEHGANINSRNKKGDTALISLIKDSDNEYISKSKRLEKLELAKFLIEKEADLNLADEDNDTALISLAYSTNRTGFAQKKEEIKILIMLIERNADLNVQNKIGVTALMLLCMVEWEEINSVIKMMLKNGANVDLQNHYGNTALMIAFNCRRFDKAYILVEHGCNLT
jgi:ankyrin repeat protein